MNSEPEMAWSSVLEAAGPKTHVVQFYGNDDRFIVRNACRYLSEGLKRRHGLLVIATPAHAEAFVLQLTSAPSTHEALQAGRIVFLDAQTTLDSFMVNGAPDAARSRNLAHYPCRH